MTDTFLAMTESYKKVVKNHIGRFIWMKNWTSIL